MTFFTFKIRENFQNGTLQCRNQTFLFFMMLVKQVFLLVLLGFSSAVFSQSRLHHKIDEDWRFHFGNAADPSKDFNDGI